MYPVQVSSDRLVLRELREDDAAPMHRVYGDPEATRHLSFEPRTLDQVTEIISAGLTAAVAEPRTVYMLAIADRGNDELVGAARLGIGEHESGQIGFALRPDQWGQRKGVEVVCLLQRLGFEMLQLHRIWGARSPVNSASQRTMTSAGMIEEGTMRGHLFTRGAWRDSVVHSILSDEYHRFQRKQERVKAHAENSEAADPVSY